MREFASADAEEDARVSDEAAIGERERNPVRGVEVDQASVARHSILDEERVADLIAPVPLDGQSRPARAVVDQHVAMVTE